MSEANAPQQRADQAAGTIEALTKQIQQLKAQRDAVILAHYYVPPEGQDVADYVGDSFARRSRRPCRSVLRQLHGRGENVVGRVRDLVKRREDLPRAAAAQHPVHP